MEREEGSPTTFIGRANSASPMSQEFAKLGLAELPPRIPQNTSPRATHWIGASGGGSCTPSSSSMVIPDRRLSAANLDFGMRPVTTPISRRTESTCRPSSFSSLIVSSRSPPAVVRFTGMSGSDSRFGISWGGCAAAANTEPRRRSYCNDFSELSALAASAAAELSALATETAAGRAGDCGSGNAAAGGSPANTGKPARARLLRVQPVD
jgi:hypothetical protein